MPILAFDVVSDFIGSPMARLLSTPSLRELRAVLILAIAAGGKLLPLPMTADSALTRTLDTPSAPARSLFAVIVLTSAAVQLSKAPSVKVLESRKSPEISSAREMTTSLLASCIETL